MSLCSVEVSCPTLEQAQAFARLAIMAAIIKGSGAIAQPTEDTLNCSNTACSMAFSPHGGHKTKCPDCCTTRVRLHRKLERHPSLEDCFETLNKDEVIARCHKVFGDDIAKLVHHELVQERTDEDIVEMIGTGNWLDAPDMNDKYKNKPERLAAIFKNSRRWVCPVGEVVLWEDMEYQSKNVSRGASKRTLTSTMAVAQKIARPKKIKVESVETDTTAATVVTEAVEKPLTAKQTEQLNKSMQDLDKLADKLKEAEERMQKDKIVNDMIPGYVKTKFRLAFAQALSVRAAIEITLENKIATGMAKQKTDVQKAKEELKAATAKLVVQLQEAEAEAAEAAGGDA